MSFKGFLPKTITMVCWLIRGDTSVIGWGNSMSPHSLSTGQLQLFMEQICMYTNKRFGLKLFSEQTYPLKAIPRPMTYTSHPTAERAISGMTN